MRFVRIGLGMTGMVVALLLLLGAAGCETTTSRRGSVEFSRVRLLTTVDRPPQLAEAPVVDYPEVLLADGVEGTAEISFVVTTSGVCRDVQIKAASDPAFGEAAAAAVRRWNYVPATLKGSRVPCQLEQTFFFRID